MRARKRLHPHPSGGASSAPSSGEKAPNRRVRQGRDRGGSGQGEPAETERAAAGSHVTRSPRRSRNDHPSSPAALRRPLKSRPNCHAFWPTRPSVTLPRWCCTPGTRRCCSTGCALSAIAHVLVSFDGSGDSGQIESIDARIDTDESVTLPAAHITFSGIDWQSGGHPTERRLTFEAAVEETGLRPPLRYPFRLAGQPRRLWRILHRCPAPGPSISSSTNGSRRPNFSLMISEGAAMAHPYHHALSSVKKWGGKVDDYLACHEFLDASKLMLADFRHRALRHHAEGIFPAGADPRENPDPVVRSDHPDPVGW